jgi:hypothetical protein
MKRNMKMILVIAMTMVLSNAFAQCSKKTDDMTKTTSVETKKQKLGGTGAKGFKTPMYVEGMMTYSDKSYVVYLFPQFADIKTIQKGSTVIVKFADESILNLKVNSTDVSIHGSGQMFTQGSSNTIWTNTVQLVLSESDVAALKAKKVTKIRVETEDYNIKSDNAFIDWISCIDKNK